MICSKCSKEFKDDALFCPYCGAKKETEEKKCVNCGAALKDNMKFCAKCGTPVATGNANNTAIPVTTEKPNIRVPTANTNQMKTTSSGHGKPIIAGIVALVAVIVGVVIYANTRYNTYEKNHFLGTWYCDISDIVDEDEYNAVGDIFYGALSDYIYNATGWDAGSICLKFYKTGKVKMLSPLNLKGKYSISHDGKSVTVVFSINGEKSEETYTYEGDIDVMEDSKGNTYLRDE